jgi:hypothetical protein
MLHYAGESLQPFIGSSGGPWWKSALQLGIGGPGLKSCGLPILTGDVCAIAGSIDTLVSTTVADNVINTNNIAAKDVAIWLCSLFRQYIMSG